MAVRIPQDLEQLPAKLEAKLAEIGATQHFAVSEIISRLNALWREYGALPSESVALLNQEISPALTEILEAESFEAVEGAVENLLAGWERVAGRIKTP